MHRLILILIFCLLTFQVAAQNASIKPESLLDLSRRNQPSSGVFTGTPFVKIEPTVGAPIPEAKSGWMDEEKKRLFGTTQITQDKFFQPKITTPTAFQPRAEDLLNEITYKTPFGKETSALFVPHTTDFISMIQVLDEKSISIDEIIQFIQTEKQAFSRVLAVPKNKKFTADSFRLIRALKDGKPFDLTVHITNDEITLSNPTELPAGIHQFHIKYIIQSGIDIQNGNGTLSYNVTGNKWPFEINRFLIYISFPSKTTVFSNNVAYGNNEVVIANSYKYKEDGNGNAIYQLNNPLPAFAPLTVYETFKSTLYGDSAFDIFFNKHIHQFIILLITVTVFIYLAVSAVYLRFKKPEKDNLKLIQSLSPITLAYAKKGRLSQTFLKTLNAYTLWAKQQKRPKSSKQYKNTRLYRLSQTCLWHWGIRQIICFALYLRLSGKYWLTVACMIFGIMYLADRQNIYLTFTEYFVTFILSGIMVILFFRKWGKRDVLQEIDIYHTKLIKSYDFYGLTAESVMHLFTRHFTRMAAIGSATEWRKKASTYSAKINDLPFISQNGERHEKTN